MFSIELLRIEFWAAMEAAISGLGKNLRKLKQLHRSKGARALRKVVAKRALATEGSIQNNLVSIILESGINQREAK